MPCGNVDIDFDPCEVEIESDPCEDIPVSYKENRPACDILMRYFSQQVVEFEEVRTVMRMDHKLKVERPKTLTQTSTTKFFC